jgi:hypothetical protein
MGGESLSEEVDAMLAGLGDWRGPVLARLRELIVEADPDIVEEMKWKRPSNPAGVPLWSDTGMVCTGGAFKDYVKITFARGASLEDPRGLFNAGLDGNQRRAIDVREGDDLDEEAFVALVREAVALNRGATGRR